MREFIESVIREAGDAAAGLFGTAGVAYTKENENDVVTEADLLSNKVIVEAIRKRYPDHGIVSEELPPDRADAECVWYIDPVDGTSNFAKRIPLWGVMIAVVEKGEPRCGSIYLPMSGELCYAESGTGAFVNGARVHASERKEWEHSQGLGSAAMAATPQGVRILAEIGNASNHTAWMSIAGSVAVAAAWMADGRKDWYWSLGAKDWDYAAPSLILREAGCVVTDKKGNPWAPGARSLLAASPALHQGLLKALRG